MPKFDGAPYTQLTSPARGDIQGVIKDVSEGAPENQTKYATQEDLHQFGSWASKVRSVTASGTVTLADTDPMFVEIDPNGADRDVSFPAKSDNNHGYYLRHSGSANVLTLKRSGGATITTLEAGEVKYIMPSTLNDFSALTDNNSGGGGGGFNQGFMTNGKIVPSVASNNLTLTLKTLAGADPSVGDKVQIRIGDVIHEITSALSVTKNAGTNWCNAGSAELATKEIDYFAYMGYNATDGVTIGFSRIPYAAIYSDFSATTTNEKYCAISTITNAASGDNYVNVGRFAATLSAGAGYTWTVPTYTSKNLIQAPIYKTRWLSYTPTKTGYSTAPTNSVYEYYVDENVVKIMFSENTAGTSNATTKTYTAPFTTLATANYQYNPALPGPTDNGSTVAAGFVYIANNSNSIGFYRSGAVNWTASGSCIMGRFMIEFRIA